MGEPSLLPPPPLPTEMINTPSHCLLASSISVEKSTVSLIVPSLGLRWLFKIVYFKIFVFVSLSLTLTSLTMMCLGMVLFVFTLRGVRSAYYL